MSYMAWIHTVSGWNGRHARLRGVWRRANDRCGGTGWAQFKQVAAGIVEAPAIIKKAVVSPEHRLPLSLYVGLLHQSERRLSDTFMNVARHHQQQPDVYQVCTMMAGWSKRHIELFQPIIDRYGEKTKHEPERLRSALFEGPRSGGVGVLRDFHDLWLVTAEVHLRYEAIKQAGKALHDHDLVEFYARQGQDVDRQLA